MSCENLFDSPNPSSKRHPFFRLTFLFVKSLLHVDHSRLVLIFGLPCFMRQKRFLSLAIDAFKIRLPRMRNFEQMIPNIESALEVVDRSTWSIFMSSCSSPASFSRAENYWSTNCFLSLDRFLHLDSLDSSFSADDSALNCVGVWAEIIEVSAQSCLSASHCCWGTVPRVNVAADEGLHDFLCSISPNVSDGLLSICGPYFSWRKLVCVFLFPQPISRCSGGRRWSYRSKTWVTLHRCKMVRNHVVGLLVALIIWRRGFFRKEAKRSHWAGLCGWASPAVDCDLVAVEVGYGEVHRIVSMLREWHRASDWCWSRWLQLLFFTRKWALTTRITGDFQFLKNLKGKQMLCVQRSAKYDSDRFCMFSLSLSFSLTLLIWRSLSLFISISSFTSNVFIDDEKEAIGAWNSYSYFGIVTVILCQDFFKLLFPKQFSHRVSVHISVVWYH